jgi:sugar phosphate isomerase/epimerase
MAEKMDTPSTDWRVFTDMTIGRPILTNQTIVGEGVIDYPSILKTAKKENIRYYVIESDFPPDPVAFAKKSIQNLLAIM